VLWGAGYCWKVLKVELICVQVIVMCGFKSSTTVVIIAKSKADQFFWVVISNNMV
jgi:hypothetical protein